jgi:hypothetical protein
VHCLNISEFVLFSWVRARIALHLAQQSAYATLARTPLSHSVHFRVLEQLTAWYWAPCQQLAAVSSTT